MPEQVDRCVESILEDPDQPDDKSRAWAICKAQQAAEVKEPEVTALGDHAMLNAEALDKLAEERPGWGRVESEYGVAWIGQQSGSTVFDPTEGNDIEQQAVGDDEWSAQTRTFRIVPSEDNDTDYRDDILGVGIVFPEAGVYVDWHREAFPDELDEPHVSEYGSLADLKKATNNQIIDLMPPRGAAPEEQMVTIRGLSQEAEDAIRARYNVDVIEFNQDVPDDAVSVSDPSEIPEDARTVTGPRGGTYYIPTGEDGDGEGSDGSVDVDVSDWDEVDYAPMYAQTAESGLEVDHGAVEEQDLDWDNQIDDSIQVDETVATQEGVRPEKVEHFIDNPEDITDSDEPIIAARDGDTTYIVDGTHRLAAANVLGIDDLPAQVYDVE